MTTNDRTQQLIDDQVHLSQQMLANAQELQTLHPDEPVPPVVTVIHVATAQELTDALASVTGPAEIRLASGTYTGNFVLRTRNDTGLVTVRADLDDAALAPTGGMPWITPAQTIAWPKLLPLDPGLPILSCIDGAHDYRLLGLELGPNLARPDMTLLELGRGDVTALDQVPARLEVDACYLHGDPQTGCRRGVSLQSAATTIRRSYIADCWYQGQDAQAIGAWTSPGELLIEANYLAGSGENVIFGGADPRIADLVTTDVTIRGNHLAKPPEWRQKSGSVKNLFELKNARHVLVEHNVFEHCWVDGQPGHAIVFTVRNQDGAAPWSTVADVTFQWNVVADVEGCFFNLLGIDDLYPSVRGSRITIAQNLFFDGGGGVQSLSGYDQTTIQHNVFTGPDWKWLQFGGDPCSAFVWLDNAVPPTEYGITGDNTGIGTPSLEHYAPGAEVRCDSIGMKGYVPYPSGNYELPQGTPPVDYLTQTATDGGMVGVDLAELQRRIPWYHLPLLGRQWVPRPESDKKPVPFGMR